MKTNKTILTIALAIAGAALSAQEPRELPRPLPSHPGNIFVEGESISIAVPAGETPWRVVDYDGKALSERKAAAGRIDLGKLSVGYYEIESMKENPMRISLAVLAPLVKPVPYDSPMGLDVAMAWFYSPDRMDAVASLCTLAGVNWVRDRLNWAQMEPTKGSFAKTNQYDASARAQHDAGLQVLQVNHIAPSRAGKKANRFPADLRDVYHFYAAMAQRWQGLVNAFEPWNEPDISMFGGHTGSEIATLQRAAYLGLKAGNPQGIACLSPFAHHNLAQLQDLAENQPWPYLDRFNFHHYEAFSHYPKIYADFASVAGGRPYWVTECNVPVKWSDEQTKEPSDADLKVQAERVAKVFLGSLAEGAQVTFYFLLPHYVERQTQFGLLRPDLTPRPAFAALANVGRFLSQWPKVRAATLDDDSEAQQSQAYILTGNDPNRFVVAAWATQGSPSVNWGTIDGAQFYDCLGRKWAPANQAIALTQAPLFCVINGSNLKDVQRVFGLRIAEVPAKPVVDRAPAEAASPFVLQAVWPEERVSVSHSAYHISSRQSETIPVYAYNFGEAPAKGALAVTAPAGWKVRLPESVTLPAGSRVEVPLELDCRGAASRVIEQVRIDGTFGKSKAMLSFRVMPEPNPDAWKTLLALPSATVAKRWEAAVSGNGAISLSAGNDELTVDAQPRSGDKWAYPRMVLRPDERVPAGAKGLALRLGLLKGEGLFRVIVEEDNGSGYVIDLEPQPVSGKSIETVALFEQARFGTGWSKPDANGRLDPAAIRLIKVGCNNRSSDVKFAIGNLRWVTY